MFDWRFAGLSEVISADTSKIALEKFGPIQLASIKFISVQILWMHQWFNSHRIFRRILEVSVQEKVECFCSFVEYLHEFEGPVQKLKKKSLD